MRTHSLWCRQPRGRGGGGRKGLRRGSEKAGGEKYSSGLAGAGLSGSFPYQDTSKKLETRRAN